MDSPVIKFTVPPVIINKVDIIAVMKENSVIRFGVSHLGVGSNFGHFVGFHPFCFRGKQACHTLCKLG